MVNFIVVLGSIKHCSANRRNLENVLKLLTWVSWRLIKLVQYPDLLLLKTISRLRQLAEDSHSLNVHTHYFLHSALCHVILLPGGVHHAGHCNLSHLSWSQCSWPVFLKDHISFPYFSYSTVILMVEWGKIWILTW